MKPDHENIFLAPPAAPVDLTQDEHTPSDAELRGLQPRPRPGKRTRQRSRRGVNIPR